MFRFKANMYICMYCITKLKSKKLNYLSLEKSKFIWSEGLGSVVREGRWFLAFFVCIQTFKMLHKNIKSEIWAENFRIGDIGING